MGAWDLASQAGSAPDDSLAPAVQSAPSLDSPLPSIWVHTGKGHGMSKQSEVLGLCEWTLRPLPQGPHSVTQCRPGWCQGMAS